MGLRKLSSLIGGQGHRHPIAGKNIATISPLADLATGESGDPLATMQNHERKGVGEGAFWK